jgi:catechol 2,3-dioxygenase
MSSLQDRRSLTKSTLIDHIARVDIRVRDVDTALSFYRDVVGLDVTERDDSSASLGSSGGPEFLRLYSAGVTKRADRRATGLFHVAIRFPTRVDLGDALARLIDAGHEIGAGDHIVSEALYVDDPDGNGVELYWDRPAESWPAPQGTAIVPMATLPVDLDGVLRAGRGTNAVGRRAAGGTDVGHVHLQVGDLDETTRFYTEVLGLDLMARMGGQAGFFSSNAYHHHVGANTWSSRGGSPPPKDHAGLERVVFAAVPSDLSALGERLGQRDSVAIRDPDGIELHFVAA